ncbi:MAG: sulfatase [Candidatus Aminicenantia bacterium]
MEIKEKGLKIWASTTSFPVLNLYMKNSKGLYFYFNGKRHKPTPFEKFFDSPPYSFCVKSGIVKLNAEDSRNKKNEELLPMGKALIEIYGGDIKINVNGKILDDNSKSMNKCVFEFEAKTGKNTIEIISEKELVKEAILKSSKNLVLFSLPRDIMPDSVRIIYQTIINEENISCDFARFLLNTEIYEKSRDYNEPKPWNLVKKLDYFDQTWTAIFAPPRTVLEFPVEISEKSILDFGYFVLPVEKSKENVHLSIYFISKKKKVALFKKALSTCEEPDIYFERIDVGKLYREKGKILFLTDMKIKKPVIVAWVIPHLYIKRENTIGIILISLDTFRRDYMGIYSGDRFITPEIDKLAKDSVVFENAYAQSSWTLPSHTSIFTGLFPVNHFTNTARNKIPDAILTLPQILKFRGFVNFAYTGGCYVSARHGFCKGFDLYKEGDGFQLPDSSTPIYERASSFLSNSKGKNFFLFLHTYQFHDPLFSPNDVKEEVFKDKKLIWDLLFLNQLLKKKGSKPFTKEEIENIKLLYRAEAKTIDKHLIGPLIRKLREEGLYDETMIILTSDHGDEIMEHGGFLHGNTLYNELIRIPLIIKFPYQKFKGKRISKNVRHVDLAPTILDFLGFEPSKYPMDGESLIPLIKGKENKERPIFSEIYYPKEKLDAPPSSAIILGNFKLIFNGKFSGNPELQYELYDLSKDPEEKKNIYSESQEAFKILKELLEEYKKKASDFSEKIVISDELREKLKALGYLQ